MPSAKCLTASAALAWGAASIGTASIGIASIGMAPAAKAQTVIDMSKYTCEQLLQGNANSIDAALWLSGYHNGTRKNAMLDLNRFKQNADAVVAECNANPKETVMKTIDKLARKK